jgi:hypothetical protein
MRRSTQRGGERTLVRGPRKPRPEGPPNPRLSTHKARSSWFQSRSAWPVREAPIPDLVRERARAREALPTPAAAAEWVSIGPANIGGRMTSLVCHPDDPERIWAGAAGGGVWQSTDAGHSWRALWHSQEVLNIGSLAIDPQNPAVLYCGTGEANLSADSYPGVGIVTVHVGRSSRLTG